MKTWNRVAIIGVGLIGASIGAALLRRKLAGQVIGIGRRIESLDEAKQLGAITHLTTDLASGVADAELVVVCTPVAQIVEHVRAAAAACPEGALITDAGSVKTDIVAEADAARQSDPAWRRGVRFVGSHPMAGAEKRGPGASSADLFVDRVVVVTPGEHSRREDCHELEAFWRSLGARVVDMSAAAHDRAVATTSHAPHLIASAIAAATPEEYVTLTAGGWLDTTRIAAGDPELWRQILLSNRANVLASLERFEQALAAMRSAIEGSAGEDLEQLLREGKRIRDAVAS
jgi:prephenate dehydrogenase